MAVPGRFGADEAPVYERIKRLVPGYELMQRLVRAELAVTPAPTAEILVAGAGTGAELASLAPAQPGWSFVAVDPAASMLAVAAAGAVASGYRDRVHLHTGYVADLPAQPRFDAAVMVLVAHFLPMGGAKEGLFADIARRLRPGAPLVFADLAVPAPPGSHLALVRRHAALDLGVPASEVDALIGTMARNLHPVDGAELDRLLTDTGFGPARCFFQGWGTEPGSRTAAESSCSAPRCPSRAGVSCADRTDSRWSRSSRSGLQPVIATIAWRTGRARTSECSDPSRPAPASELLERSPAQISATRFSRLLQISGDSVRAQRSSGGGDARSSGIEGPRRPTPPLALDRQPTRPCCSRTLLPLGCITLAAWVYRLPTREVPRPCTNCRSASPSPT